MIKNPVIAFLKLIRIENLLIIAITQWCIKYLVFAPINEFSKLTPALFIISLISTLLIAAAGYIINDYFDVKTDRINRPETVVIDIVIKRRVAMILHIIFNAIGLILGLYLSLKCHSLALLLFQITSILLLWFYSTHFKKQLLVGNIVVSLLTAAIPLMPMVYDYYLMGGLDPFITLMIGDFFKTLVIIVLGYSAFAFLTSFTREVIKDMEDYKGDIQTGCKTMPIVWGMITSKVVTFFLIIITIGLLLLACLKFYREQQYIAVYYISGLIIVQLILLIILIIRSKTSKDFKMASLLLKFTMLFGIGFTFIIKYLYE
ncbi:MAG: geranylgeranylglycerol-phosphate geranylgeranyltransferase [Burkholderiales bacterium]|nr:geranylgeranylglycerol-phosphate geranylgeranyltransferase [Bacteroidia bacterium]